MNTSRRRRIQIYLAIMALVSLALLRACVLRPAAHSPGAAYNRGTNAVWLGIEWVNAPDSADKVASLVDELQRLQIRDVYVYTSYLRSTGEFGETFGYAAEFTRRVKLNAPSLRLQAWIGIPLLPKQGAFLDSRGDADLSQASVRRRIATFAARVQREGGFDGVHLDPEPALDGDPDLLALLDEVRAAVGPAAALSIATPRISLLDGPFLVPPGVAAWSSTYYREVAQRVDQVALMTYDSALATAWLYRQWGRFEVIALSRALSGRRTEVLIGIPVSREATWTHRPAAESMANGLRGTIDGLNDAASRPQTVTGVAIYPFWEATEEDWHEYRRWWLSAQ